MHSIRHWTLRYLVDRFKDKLYRKRHPGFPWLAPEAIRFLETFLRPTDKGLEFGSGRSTLWFASRVAQLTSVEHNQKWYSIVNENLQNKNIKNVSYHYFPKTENDPSGKDSAYVHVVDSITAASLDFILIDGTYRSQCVLRSIPLLASGGILIIDNVNKYLPSASHAPNSRSIGEGPLDAEWQQVLEIIGSWRGYWTGNGVSDTAIYFKPQ
jgi:predicted O-methyltransferase YrrM